MRTFAAITVLALVTSVLAGGEATVCTDSYRGGSCERIVILGVPGDPFNQCHNNIESGVSSVYPEAGFKFTLFTDSNCNGGKQLDVYPPGIDDLAPYGINDQTRAYKINPI